MRFQVPQFIDVEDKIFGPFTLKQFIYLAGAAGVAVVCMTVFSKIFGILLASPVVALALALAFYKPNNRAFIYQLESMYNYYLADKLYIWKKLPRESTAPIGEGHSTPQLNVPTLTRGKLSDMNWNLDVKKEDGDIEL